MGFRNPITTATDPVARDLANQALTQIIPGSRLAADAIDGKTITGALIRTAATGPRLQLTASPDANVSTGSLLFYSGNTGESVGGVSTYTDPQSRSVLISSGADAPARTVVATLNLGHVPGDTPGTYTSVVTFRADRIDVGDTPTVMTFPGRLRLTSTGDVSQTGTGHPLQIGPDTGVHFIIDNNEAMALAHNGSTFKDDLSSFGLTVTNFAVAGTQTLSKQGTTADSVLRKDYVDARFASGIVLITPTAANTPTSAVISFGKTFGAAPSMSVTPVTTVPGTAVTGVSVSSVTTTGATLWLTRNSTTATSVQWIAVDSGF